MTALSHLSACDPLCFDLLPTPVPNAQKRLRLHVHREVFFATDRVGAGGDPLPKGDEPDVGLLHLKEAHPMGLGVLLRVFDRPIQQNSRDDSTIKRATTCNNDDDR